MTLHWLQILFLAIVQGLAEMLPVSSSAHVILAEKWMGLDPSAPEMTFLLVMLHTGTMFAALVYFWSRWKSLIFPQGSKKDSHFLKMIVLATVFTGGLGLTLKVLIEKIIFEKLMGHEHAEVEHLFKNLPLMGAALFLVGVFIILTSSYEKKAQTETLTSKQAIWIGLIQGLCLPFRGFSRSGATISTGLYWGVSRKLSEEFSFALALVITPPVILLELKRLMKASHTIGETSPHFLELLTPGLIGMSLSFISAWIALKWLSSWLENGRWKFFGYYCLGFSMIVIFTHFNFA